MTDTEINYLAMARVAAQYLADSRATWEAAAPRMLPDYLRLTGLLADAGTVGTTLSGTGSKGYTDAKDLAEDLAVAAAMRVVKGLRTVQLNTYRPELVAVAAYTKSGLDRLRDENLVTALAAVAKAAAPLAAELAAERVKAEQLEDLDKKIAAYRPLVGTPRGQVVVGSTLRTTARKLVAQLHTAFEPLDTRMESLGEEPEFATLFDGYQKARVIVDAGHGPQDAQAPK